VLQRALVGTLQGVSHGVELAVRGGAAPLVLGLRWRGWKRLVRREGAPAPRRGLALASKVALDEIFYASEVVSATMASLRELRRVARELEEALTLYEARGWLDHPEGFHIAPPPLRDVETETKRSRFGDHAHVRFESGYAPHPGEPGRERWQGYQANRTAHVRLLEHPGPPRPWLVCIPGYRMGQVAVDFMGFRTRWLHRTLGLNVAIPVMPLHGPRRAGRRGGDGWFSGELLDTVHAQAQAIWDLRRLVDWLRHHKHAPNVGAYGVSLGAHTAALLAAHDAELACVIAGIPASDLVRLLRTHVPEVVVRAAERLGHLSLDSAARALRVVSPLAVRPLVPREHRYLYAGVADRLASPEHALDLWRHWEEPRLAWYQGSHISFLWERSVTALLREALVDSGLLARI
jgi:hypothetical protein